MIYDFMIVGTGSAGYAAAIYAGRYRMQTLMLGAMPGGLLTTAHWVENYPGIKRIKGFELMDRMLEHVKEYDICIYNTEVTTAEKTEAGFRLGTADAEYEGKTLLLATGTQHRHLGVPGEHEFAGKGVSYCFTCDGPLYRDAVTCIVGGADSAGMGALMLAEHSKKVYVIYRRSKMRCEPYFLERIESAPNIELVYDSNVTEITGDDFVKKVKLDTGREIALDGVFIEIGADPVNDLAKQLSAELDRGGYVKVDDLSQTNIPGLYAAGDVTPVPLKQAIIGCAQGAMAAFSAFQHIQRG
jgi:thioredoxin reductase (NADPH)